MTSKRLKTFRFRNKKTKGCRRVKAETRKEAWRALGEAIADDLSFSSRRRSQGYIPNSRGTQAAKRRYTAVKRCSNP